LSAPAAWLIPPRGVRVVGLHRPDRTGISPSGFAPLQSMTRDAAHHRARSPEVCRPLSATQPSRSTTPGRLPVQVTLRPRAYHAPRRLAPSAASLVSLSTRRAHGVRTLQSLTWPWSRSPLGARSPSRLTMPDRRSLLDARCRCPANRGGLVSGDVPQPVGTFRAGYSPLFDGPGSPGFGLLWGSPLPCATSRSTVCLIGFRPAPPLQPGRL